MGNSHATSHREDLCCRQSEPRLVTELAAGGSLNATRSEGKSVFRLAIEKDLPALVQECYQACAELQPPLMRGQSLLHFAVEHNRVQVVRTLLREVSIFGDLITVQDSAGRSALHLAVLSNNAYLVALLLKYNSDSTLVDNAGLRPIDYADTSQEVFELLSVRESQVYNKPIELCQDLTPTEDSSALEPSLSQVQVIPKSELQLYEVLGQGSTCIVYRGLWNNTDVAVKQFKTQPGSSQRRMDKFLKEMRALATVNHPNVLLLIGVSVDSLSPSLVTEYMPNGTLFSLLHKQTVKLTLSQRFSLALQLCRGLLCLHTRTPPIVHRDLKPENCLIDYDLNLKIADFGLARAESAFRQEQSASMTTVCIGTARFMAPELFDSRKLSAVGPSADIWALGCVLNELFSGKRPWSYIPSSQANCISYEMFQLKPVPIPDCILPEVRALIQECCRYRAQRRPTIQEVLSRLECISKTYSST